jgi:hypothetical protein
MGFLPVILMGAYHCSSKFVSCILARTVWLYTPGNLGLEL